MTDPDRDPSLEDLGERLRAARDHRDRSQGGRLRGGNGGGLQSGLGFGFRIGVELVAAVAVGVALGYFLDRWLGTGPWLLVIFFFLGAAAGMLNVYRVAKGYDSSVGFQKPAQNPDRANGRKANEEE